MRTLALSIAAVLVAVGPAAAQGIAAASAPPVASAWIGAPVPAGANAALSRMTPQNTAVIYVDYKTGLDNLMNTMPPEQYRNNVAAFSKFAGLFSLPAAVLGEENEYYGTFLPEMRPVLAAGGRTFPRTTPTGYTRDLATWLEQTGRKKVLIGGISIDNCTLHTALDLKRAGYEVYVVVDVSGANSGIAEEAAIDRMVMAGIVPGSWLNALTELGQDFNGPYGRGMMEIVQTNWPASTIGPVRDLTPDGRGLQPVASASRAGRR
jgi:hypothetical protein